LSPLLAQVLLDEVDQAPERRGHRFVRYAYDCTVDANLNPSNRPVRPACRVVWEGRDGR
jgi:hypothetical protein